MKFFRTFGLIKKLVKGQATGKDKLSLTLRIFGWLSSVVTFFLLFIVGMAVIAVLVSVSSSNSSANSLSINSQHTFPESVLRWEPYVRREAEANEIPHAVNYLLTIILLETRGNAEQFPDIMQASESQGLPPNTITDPLESIRVGVAYFAGSYRQFPDHDLLNILQAFNFGRGFLNYTLPEYNFETAVSFARNLSGGVQVTYTNPLAISINGGWRYAYGNMFYAKLAAQYIRPSHDGEWGLPVLSGFIITSHFGNRIHPITGILHFHNGIDLVTPNMADPPIFAVADGTVVFSGWAGGYGNYIVIQHDETTFSGYAHNRVNHVNVGDRVSRGDVIAIMGTTGDSTGVHLHMEIMLNTTDFWRGHVDPAPLLNIRR